MTLTVTDGAQSDTMSGDVVVTNPMVTTPTPNPARTPVIVQPILVPVKDPHHERPPHYEQPPAEKQPIYKDKPVKKTPVKSPEKDTAKDSGRSPRRRLRRRSPARAPEVTEYSHWGYFLYAEPAPEHNVHDGHYVHNVLSVMASVAIILNVVYFRTWSE